MTKDEALKMAIEWVEGWKGIAPSKIELLRVLREALEQPAQEPVGYTEPADLESVPQGDTGLWFAKKDERYSVPLYTHPAPSWQGLSDDEKQEAIDEAYKNFKEYCRHKVTQDINEKDGIEYWVARAIEQALKEKNT